MELSEFLQKLTDAAEAIKSQVLEHGPEAWEVTEQVIRIDAAIQIGTMLFFLLLTMAVIYYYILPVARENYPGTMDKEFHHVAAFVAGFASFFGLLIPIVELANKAWLFVALYSPKLYLAHKALDGIL